MTENVQRITGTGAKSAARLCNFSTGAADLLQAHIAYLDSEVAPVIRGMNGPWVDLLGYASRLGDAASNKLLSERRVQAVEQRISQYASNVNFQIQTGLGESTSGADESDDSGYWRAVDVFVYAHKPPQPRRVPPVVVVSAATSFEVRVVGGGSASIFVQADNYFFQIVDKVRRKTAFFFYTGGGLGISIPKIPGPGSMTKAGPPTAFHTTRPAELYMFNSPAALFQDAGAMLGSYSVEGTLRLSIKQIRDSSGLIFTRPNIIPITSGSGIQMPGLGSASEGVLAMASAEFPFVGY